MKQVRQKKAIPCFKKLFLMQCGAEPRSANRIAQFLLRTRGSPIILLASNFGNDVISWTCSSYCIITPQKYYLFRYNILNLHIFYYLDFPKQIHAFPNNPLPNYALISTFEKFKKQTVVDNTFVNLYLLIFLLNINIL